MGYEELRKEEILHRLKKIVLAETRGEGAVSTAVPSLYAARHTVNVAGGACMHEPMAGVLVQGRKEIRVGASEYEFSRGQTLVVSVESPSSSFIMDATPEKPFLALHFTLDPTILTDLLAETPQDTWPEGAYKSAVGIIDSSLEFMETFLRLASLTEKPEQILILAPLILRELHYLLLVGPRGAMLRDLYLRGAADNRVIEVIALLKKNLNRSVSAAALARKVNMSVSSLHRQFKRVTGVSPLQYHKKLRLCEARRRMLAENERADIAALAVGYESTTHFNREYKRFFGEPPRRDIQTRKRMTEDGQRGKQR